MIYFNLKLRMVVYLKKGTQNYIFTYFPDKTRGIRDKWHFQFDVQEIKSIARGELKTLLLWACQDESCGCKFQDPDDTCFYCDYVEEIYVALLNENVEVWRPIEAILVEKGIYRIISENLNPDDEQWEFSTGDLVQCSTKIFSGGSSGLVAMKKAD